MLPAAAVRCALFLEPGNHRFLLADCVTEVGIDHVRCIAAQRAGHVEHREHQEDARTEERDRRDEARPLAVDVAPGQLARTPGEHRQGSPDLALEIEHAVEQVLEEAAQRAVDVRFLAAGMAILAGQLGPAIEAVRSRACGRRRPRRFRLDRARQHRAGRCVAQCFEIRHPLPLRAILGTAPTPMLAARADEAHRTSRRLVQPGAPRTPADQPGGHRCARPRRSVVAGLARQPAQAAPRTWRRSTRASPRPSRWRAGRRSGSAISRPARAPATPSIPLAKLAAPLSARPLHLADGRRHCCPIPSVEAIGAGSPESCRLR